MNTAEILRAAAQRVRQGWAQFTLNDGDGGVCAGGAINQSMRRFNSEQAKAAANAVASAMRLPLMAEGALWSPAWGAMVAWNNAPDQTAENVAAGLEYAALVWEQEQAQATPAEQPVAVERA